MDEMLYEILCHYYSVLSKTGYYSYSAVKKMLVLLFYYDFVYRDYRGKLNKSDYMTIETALNCLYGSTCLIPYPNYKKMGRLHLGEVTEMAQRLKNVEETKVVKSKEDIKTVEDIVIETT